MTTEACGTGGKITYYTQKDFERMINQGICYSIPIQVLHKIRDIEAQIKKNSVVQQKKFENKRFHVPKNNNWRDNPTHVKTHGDGKESQTVSGLEKKIGTSHVFKPTKPLVNSAEIPESTKLIQRIKLNLNKMSKQNYDKLQKEIIEDLKLLVTEFETGGDGRVYELINDLFHIISKTSDVKMSELYAKCYFDWVEEFEPTLFQQVIFQQVINDGIEEYCRLLMEFKLIEADKDSDVSCKYNRFISEHRGRIVFLIQYAKLQEELVGKLYSVLLNDLVNNIRTHVEDSNVSSLKKMFVDEWIEHVVLFLNLGGSMWIQHSTEEYKIKIHDVLEELSKTNVKEKPNMTVRSKFKLQGVL